MLRPMSGKVILKEKDLTNSLNGIYVPAASKVYYEIVAVANDETTFNIGDVVIVDKKQLFLVEDAPMLYICNKEDLLAIVEK